MAVVVSIAGPRLLVESSESEHVDHVVDALGAACTLIPEESAGVDWSLFIEPGVPPVPEQRQWPRLELRSGGPALTVLGNQDGVSRALGYYRPQAAPVGIEVDRRLRQTRLVVSSTYVDQTHWSAWLTKMFFASRLLATGWRMLHASAVVVGGVAVVFVAEPGGGKSTLAHRACRELGAAFLADDLVLLGPEGTVIGWPTRVCLPQGLEDVASVDVGRLQTDLTGRRRWVVSLPEHRSLGIIHGSPAPLGAVVHVRSGTALTSALWNTKTRGEAEREACDIPVQRLYTSDLLGLMGGPSTQAPEDQGGVFAPAVGMELTLPHTAELPTAPVWEALADVLPLMRGARP